MSRKENKQIEHLSERMMRFFDGNPKKSFTFKQLYKKIKNKKYSVAQLEEVLKILTTKDLIYLRDDRYKKSRLSKAKKSKSQDYNDSELIEGVVDATRSGSAFIICADLEKDVFVTKDKLNRAFDGDTVKIVITKNRNGRKLEGKVVEVVKRSQELFVGTIELSSAHAFCVPDRKIGADFFIPKGKFMKAETGDKVVVLFEEWPEGKKSPVGKVVEILGKPGNNDVVMKSILIDKGFSLSFKPETLKEVSKIPMDIPQSEIDKRRDMRKVLTCTIDPVDAKDFDDALSFQKLENGLFEIGVHIADVTHYVRPNTALDKEGAERSTSVYLVDRVLPMYPEQISNVICSLRPEEEKLCFSVVFQMDEKGKVHDKWFGRTVIYSDKRFAYEEAQVLIESKKRDKLTLALKKLNKIAKILRKKRFENGAIDFDKEEIGFRLDEDAKPIEIYIKTRKDAHLMIEDYMLLANQEVAAFVNGKKKTMVNRAHQAPDDEKLLRLKSMAGRFGYEMEISKPKLVAKSINALMRAVKGKPEQVLFETLSIRTMAKAKYTTENVGHYGLGFDNYGHFTSPIRRYPDVMTHRLLQDCLDGKVRSKKEDIEKACVHSSMMERKAMDAEWDSIRYKQAQYLADYVGDEFDGVISGVQAFGVFVSLTANKCEGMIRIEYFDDDYYYYDEELQCLSGKTNNKKYQLGAPIRVVVAKVDVNEKQIDLGLVNS